MDPLAFHDLQTPFHQENVHDTPPSGTWTDNAILWVQFWQPTGSKSCYVSGVYGIDPQQIEAWLSTFSSLCSCHSAAAVLFPEGVP